MDISLSIIGTAGRKDDEKKLSLKSFQMMMFVAEKLLVQLKDSNYSITTLVSGGAAWADHVAVKLFLNKTVPKLTLYIPSPFQDGAFVSNKKIKTQDEDVNVEYNTGSILNNYHRVFQRITGINSLSEIEAARGYGANLIECSGGFMGRNTRVASSEFLLAMTFGNENMVKEGGTADTVRKYLKRIHEIGIVPKGFHYNLTDGKIYKNLTAPIK